MILYFNNRKSCFVVFLSSFFFFSLLFSYVFYSLYISSLQTSFLICVPYSTNTKANEYTKRYLTKQHIGDVTTPSLLFFSPQDETTNEFAKENERRKNEKKNSLLILRSNTNNNLSSVTNVDEHQLYFLNINL